MCLKCVQWKHARQMVPLPSMFLTCSYLFPGAFTPSVSPVVSPILSGLAIHSSVQDRTGGSSSIWDSGSLKKRTAPPQKQWKAIGGYVPQVRDFLPRGEPWGQGTHAQGSWASAFQGFYLKADDHQTVLTLLAHVHTVTFPLARVEPLRPTTTIWDIPSVMATDTNPIRQWLQSLLGWI